MELVTFQEQDQTTHMTAASTVVTTKKPRKSGAGRKQMYTSKCITYSAAIPLEAIDEVKDFVKNLKIKYKK